MMVESVVLAVILSLAGPVEGRGAATHAPAADREAILAMAGAYHVDFRFEETVARQSGYELTPPYNEEAIELVEVIADKGDFISLQHLLVVGSPSEPVVVKHWRQDWRYEDADILAYRGLDTWRRMTLSPEEARGRWTQAVFQTTDAPRYEAAGQWIHTGDTSTWESDITRRPLPRREEDRLDYDVMICRNRHTITPGGWVHEQDNRKAAVTDDGEVRAIIAHEIGVNTYERIDASRVEAAAAYWRKHAAAWAEVRAAWQPLLEQGEVTIDRVVHDRSLFTLIDHAIADAAERARLAESLRDYVTSPRGEPAAGTIAQGDD